MTELFWNTIYLLHSANGFLVKPTDRECLGYIAPMHFKNTFPKLNCIIDCFEIFIDQPKNLKAQTYSNYKYHNTAIVFIACNLRGAIIFVSTV